MWSIHPAAVLDGPAAPPPAPQAPATPCVLITDNESPVRFFCRQVLATNGILSDEAEDGIRALEKLRQRRYDLVLLDVDMPGLDGLSVLRRLRDQPPVPHFKVIMFSGRSSGDELAEMLEAGADDFLTKPFTVTQLLARVKGALRLKEVQDRADRLNRHLLAMNESLELALGARDGDLIRARNALVLALAKLAGCRDSETGGHLLRLQQYARCLAEAAAEAPGFAELVDANFVHLLECCAPLHDLGKVGLPDGILRKPGRLTPEERLVMQSHTTVGANMLSEVAREQVFESPFWEFAVDIARHHHERWDGRGYPYGLQGEAIPLAARLITIGDVYDALRSPRVYKPGLSHGVTLEEMLGTSFAGHFDPALLRLFEGVAHRFAEIFARLTDEEA